MFTIRIWLLLTSFCPLLCLAAQFPNGFITLNEHIDRGGFIKNVLQEPNSQQFVIALQQGMVINEGGIVTVDGKIFKDTETYQEDQHRLLRNQRDLTSEDSIFFDGKLAVISSPGQENWYHWLFQVLPRIKILLDSGVEYDKIYINNLKFRWQQESLEIIMRTLNLPQERLFLIEGDCIVRATTLIVPSVPFIPSKSPVFPCWLKKFLIDAFLIKENRYSSPERIYISRSKASVRRISNENEVIEMLKQHGFVLLNLEELPIHKQAEYFHNAKIIIGPHGSGFSNLIFSNPGTIVIEIDHGLPGDEQRSFYKRMAEIMDCHYFGYYVDLVGEDDLEKDIQVNVLDLYNFCKKNELCSEILEMVAKEQELRMQWVNASDRVTKDAVRQLVMKIDETHLSRLKEIIENHGWPGYSLIGHEGSHAFWLLVQHTPDVSFQKYCLKLLERAVTDYDASAIDLAYLKDRVLVRGGKKQIYGTQVDHDLIPFPIEEESFVNDRRTAIGLAPLEEYLDSIKKLFKEKLE